MHCIPDRITMGLTASKMKITRQRIATPLMSFELVPKSNEFYDRSFATSNGSAECLTSMARVKFSGKNVLIDWSCGLR
jgi:hypothetical protein